ncbi:MAG TPA: ABC transporter ATP-binding protein [Caulobacterales bacterium]|jgi:putative ABC transport system ATP-binding protein|nr:ABC transporter ATP-binding protein [Caulobacterales bacterium]
MTDVLDERPVLDIPRDTPPPPRRAPRETLIEARDLTKTYVMGDNIVRALAGVSFSVKRGEYLAIIGPSGSGKSTLMNVLGGLDRPDGGLYKFEGEEVSAMDDNDLAEFRNRKIGFIFQSFQLLPRLNAQANVELPLVYAGMPRAERAERALAMLAKVGLAERADHKPTQLSGGQQQRVAIARALAGEPSLLLADEPTGALDSRTGQDVLALFDQLHAQGATLIIVTHDPGVAARAERVIEMRDGEIIRDGAPQ